MVRELANNESAYRSITLSWFRHSVLFELFRMLSQTDCTVLITTDHGSIRATRPVKIIGDRNTNTNLRYKLGKNLSYNDKEIFVIKEPAKAQLPSPNLSTSYVFATGDAFFAYPNNYNYYVSYYKDTFQHGGYLDGGNDRSAYHPASKRPGIGRSHIRGKVWFTI